MRSLTLLQAMREALIQEMDIDSNVFLIGEDIRIGGGFSVTKGLLERFGEDRVLDTPISETGFTGASIGAAVMGMRPVVEYQFGDFVFCAMDQIINEAAKLHYMSGGQVSVPVVFRLPVGANRRAAQHSQCSESIFMGVPGLKLAVPSSPFDAKGLLIAAIRDNNPVLFFEHKLLYNVNKFESKVEDYVHQDVPEEDYEIPFGKAEVKREGEDVTVVATHLMLHRSLEAADLLHKEGIKVEVIDPRTLVPLDINTVTESVRKTGKLVVVHESPKTGGWAGEFISSVSEITGGNCKVKRVTTHDVPIPYAPVLEDYAVPGMERIKAEIKNILK